MACSRSNAGRNIDEKGGKEWESTNQEVGEATRL